MISFLEKGVGGAIPSFVLRELRQCCMGKGAAQSPENWSAADVALGRQPEVTWCFGGLALLDQLRAGEIV